MSDPRTGGVTQEPRKTKENGVKNLKGAQSTSDFHIDSFLRKIRQHLLFLVIMILDLDYSRAKVAADARHRA